MIMSSAEGQADVQVTRPGHIFPFGAVGGNSPLPQLTQCCRFSIPERLPLRPFRQDRLQRLPLTPSLMASSAKTVAPTGAGAAVAQKEKRSDVDPFKKIEQLEENIKFIQEGHALMLTSLHKEINDLTQKNRELQFQLVTGSPALPPEAVEKKSEEIPAKAQEKIEKLEKEVKKLRNALKDALKNNSTLSNEVQALKRERHALLSSGAGNSSKSPKEATGGSRRGRGSHGLSPDVEEYNDTLRQIQRAHDKRGSKSSEGQHNDHSGKYWGKGGSGYLENRRSYNYHHRMVQQSQSEYQQQQHARLPRLPLRNQLQNYMHHNQYDMQYQQHRPTAALPSLKQSHNDHANRQRKTRGGPQHAQVAADQVYNH